MTTVAGSATIMNMSTSTKMKFGRIERRDWCVDGSEYQAAHNPTPVEALDR